jgi:hypothetical protein
MLPAMPWTPDQLATLDAAILAAAQGKTVQFADRSYTAQDLGDLMTLRAEVARALADPYGTAGSSRLAAFSKGV